MNDEQALARAHRAYNELTETQGIFEKLRAAMVERLVSTGVEQSALREKMYFGLQTMNAVEKALREAVDAGNVVKHAQAAAELLAPPRG